MKGKKKCRRLIITILFNLFLLFLNSCNDQLYVLAIQKGGDNYFVGKVSYYDWTGRGGTIVLFDIHNNTEICRGKYHMLKNSVACHGKTFQAKLACSVGRAVDFNFTTMSCTESYGTAVDDLGNTYEVYFGTNEVVRTRVRPGDGSSLAVLEFTDYENMREKKEEKEEKKKTKEEKKK